MPIGKFALVARELQQAADVRLLEPSPVTETDLLRGHAAHYIDAVRSGEPRALAESQKFPWSPELFPSVCLTSGGCLAAARCALREGVSAALVSGFHHACADHGEGFCTFNGLIVAIDAMVAAGEIRTAAVLDMDLHYGNGTAALAASRPYIRALSIYGNDYMDNVSFRDVIPRRHSDGENHCSWSLPAGCDGAGLTEVMNAALPWIIEKGKPDLLLFQAGADPYFEDPFSPLALGFDELQRRDWMVLEFARQNRIPIAWVLAGGYTRDVKKVVRVHLNTFEAWRDVYGRATIL
ncbi:MAG: Histone deacetylase superfamily [Chthoniobacteraceae bacterium]|nr:Histone deacetylase superfamily [Chthoniobacteraceae bacterium]